jgi:hypothetical protein
MSETNQQITEKENHMRRLLPSLFAVVLLFSALARPASASVNVNVNLGLPFPQIVLPAPPQFILPPALGFYVAVDIPYDMFLISGSYYLFRDNGWYRASHYDGPWRGVEYRHLPPGLRKHSYDRIRYYRDDEYRRWDHDRRHYKGRYFRPVNDWKAHQKWEKERWKEERKHDKQQWKDERKMDRGERRDDYRDDRGPGRNDRGQGRGGK